VEKLLHMSGIKKTLLKINFLFTVGSLRNETSVSQKKDEIFENLSRLASFHASISDFFPPK